MFRRNASALALPGSGAVVDVRPHVVLQSSSRRRPPATVAADLYWASVLSLVLAGLLLLLARDLLESPLHAVWELARIDVLDARIFEREARARAYLTERQEEDRASSSILARIAPPLRHRARLVGHGRDAELCVNVVSSARSEPYVLRTVASILYAQTLANAPAVRAVILDLGESRENLAILGEAHPKLNVLSRTEIPVQARKADLSERLEAVEAAVIHAESTGDEWTMKHAWINAERVHYALALEWCALEGCASCLVVENDALFARDFSRRTVEAIRTLNGKDEEWGLIRLFRSNRFEGWAKTDRDGNALIMLSVCGAVVALALAQARQRTRLVWVVFGAAWGVLLPYLVGKPYLPFFGVRAHPGLNPAAPYGAVSTIAHVFPNRLLGDLVSSLAAPFASMEPRNPVDLMLGDLLERWGKTLWEIVPNPAEHIGTRTSFRGAANVHRAWHAKFVQSASFDPRSTVF